MRTARDILQRKRAADGDLVVLLESLEELRGCLQEMNREIRILRWLLAGGYVFLSALMAYELLTG